MEKLLTVLVLTVLTLLAPSRAQAQNWYPPTSYCTVYGGVDDFTTWQSALPWSPWVNGVGSVIIGTNANARSAPGAAYMRVGPSAPAGSFVVIDKLFNAQRSDSYFVEDICGGGFVEPNPNSGSAAWCTVVAHVKPQMFGVTGGSLSVMNTNYNQLSVTYFTLLRNTPYTYVQSSWIANCPKDIIVRVGISGGLDALVVDDVYTVWYY